MRKYLKKLTIDEWFELVEERVNEGRGPLCQYVECVRCPFSDGGCKYNDSGFETASFKYLNELYEEQKNIRKNIKLVESL